MKFNISARFLHAKLKISDALKIISYKFSSDDFPRSGRASLNFSELFKAFRKKSNIIDLNGLYTEKNECMKNKSKIEAFPFLPN